jgi:Flp pilus assembly protein TadD
MELCRWLALLALISFGLASSGCTVSLPGASGAKLPGEAALLSGQALFGEQVSAAELPDADVRGLDEEMRAFVARAVAGVHTSDARLDRLLHSMLRSGLFSLDYDGEQTLTASETFYAGSGNCLAFTNLFVALAREAQLKAVYQDVDVPASWTGDGDLAILHQHVNVLVRDSIPGRYPSTTHAVVDFNQPSFSSRYPQRPISDEHVDALFYNNLGADAMREGATRHAFVYFLKAITTDSNVAASWTNLGVLYRRNHLPEYAEAALRRALQVDSRHKPAMSNLARLYEEQGNQELAEAYRELVRRHQQRNPYYHFARAESALAEGSAYAALASIDQAIRLRKDEHRFHHLRAVILSRIGRHDASRASLERAREVSSVAQLQDLYDRKLGKL